MTEPVTGRAFVDINIVVYAANESPAVQAKHDAAVELLARDPEILVLSTQVLQEFSQVVTRRLEKPLEPQRAAAATRALTRLDVVGSDAALVLAAIETSRSAQLSIWARSSSRRRAGRVANVCCLTTSGTARPSAACGSRIRSARALANG